MSRTHIFGLCLLAGLVGCGTDDPTNPGVDGGGGVDAPPFTNGVSTLSGHADPGYVDGVRGEARFANPVNVAYGPDGKLYVADFDNGKIRVVDVDDGTTGTVVAQEGFRRPFGMTFTNDGKLYVGTDNNATGGHDATSGTIWRVNITARTANVVAENVGRARGLAALPDGRLVFSDYQSHVIQIVDPATGAVTPLAGSAGQKGMADGVGSAALFAQPYGIGVLPDGKLVVADYENHRLRLVAMDGTVSTYAGAGTEGFVDGAMGTARFYNPQGVAVAANGDLYVTDINNFRLRRISGTTVETIAGNGTGGYVDSDDKLAAELYGLEGISLKPDGSELYIADGGRGEDLPFNRIRSVKM